MLRAVCGLLTLDGQRWFLQVQFWNVCTSLQNFFFKNSVVIKEEQNVHWKKHQAGWFSAGHIGRDLTDRKLCLESGSFLYQIKSVLAKSFGETLHFFFHSLWYTLRLPSCGKNFMLSMASRTMDFLASGTPFGSIFYTYNRVASMGLVTRGSFLASMFTAGDGK